MPITLAFLGPRGTFSDEAADLWNPTSTRRPCATLEEVVEAVARGRADQAIAPMENSLAGGVNAVVDHLVATPEVRIIAEMLLPVDIHLIGRPEAQVAGIRTVLSKAEALEQCGTYLASNFPGIEKKAWSSTSGAVAHLARCEDSVAALGPRGAARLHGMKILAGPVQDRRNNVTRFVILGLAPPEPTGRDRTSIVFDFEREDAPGLVYAALKPFAEAGINLSRIESRPTGRRLGHYHFLLDFDGHERDPQVAAVLGQLRGHAAMFRVLGSYPRAAEPGS